MYFDPLRHRTVKNYIGYFAGAAISLKTMAEKKCSLYDLSIALLAAIGQLEKLFPYFYFTLYDEVIDGANPLLTHPELDERTRLRVHEIRGSANDMDIVMLAKTIIELDRIRKLLP